jgi:hypothetical protein
MRHEYQDRVSLELARRVASELSRRPELIQHARDNLARWSERNKDAPGLLRCYREWQDILERPLAEVVGILTAENDLSRRLRQNSPFTGILSVEDVREIKDRLRDDSRAA